MVYPPVYYGDPYSPPCLSFRHDYLDLDPTYNDVYGLPLPRLTFAWHDNDLRMMKHMDERRTEICWALNGSRMAVRA